MHGYDATEETFDPCELQSKPALFTNSRINHATVPDGLFAYDLRRSGYGNGAATLEKRVLVDHMGTILTAEPLDFHGQNHLRIGGRNSILNFDAEHECTTVAELQQHVSGQRSEPMQVMAPMM